MAVWLICGFIVVLLYTEKKYTTILTLKSKLSGKFQRFSAIDGSVEMLKNSWISNNSIKMKIFKKF